MKILFNIFLWLLVVNLIIISQPILAQQSSQNHYKTWMFQPQPVNYRVHVKDQFMEDSLTLFNLSFLSNPTLKVHNSEPFPIIDPDDHLTWYNAIAGKDTTINLIYKNQFESTAVTIGKLEFLLVPTQKQGHNPPKNLDHYKAYHILDPQTLHTPIMLQDQFDLRYGLPEYIDSLQPQFFLTPTIKNGELQELYDPITHYVAYQIFPPRFVPYPEWEYQTNDQFGTHYVIIMHSLFLLVPSEKYLTPTQPDTGHNHFKTWKINPETIDLKVRVDDQFMTDSLHLSEIEYISNPAQKVHGEDTFHILKPNDHLLWYKAEGRDTSLLILYENQFELSEYTIDSVKYLLVPAQKMPHNPPVNLDHYKAYKITKPRKVSISITLRDQFDDIFGQHEEIDHLLPLYFLTPAMKNMEAMHDSVVHYIAYEISPKRAFQYTTTANDQFGTHDISSLFSDLLLVPTLKKSVTPVPPECSDGIDNDGDGLIDYPADCGCTDANDKSEAPNPSKQCSDGIDNDQDGLIDYPADPGCSDVCDNDETDLQPQCNDGIDNDGDGLIDYPADCGCTDASDNTEAPNPPTQCSDGIDNDGDGFIDYPADPGCSDVCDNDESNPPIPDTTKSHYKTWLITPVPFQGDAQVKDEFMTDIIHLIGIEYLSNPVRKIHGLDTFNIVKPDDHLTWYRAIGRHKYLNIEYVNQFEYRSVNIDSVCYLLVPTIKVPHNPPLNLDHYKAYRIKDPVSLPGPIRLFDQFDQVFGSDENIDILLSRYFLTPVSKNQEPIYDSATHYLAYEILPKRINIFQNPINTIDQFGPHVYTAQISDLLLVPTSVVSVSSPYDSIIINPRIGWNMISVPLIVNDFRTDAIFPTAVSKAFTYQYGYVIVDTLDHGPGYWLKFNSTNSITIRGNWCDPETVDVNTGWNMIGSASEPVCTNLVSSIPGGIVTSSFYGYNGSTYYKTDTLFPGSAYWVKVNQAGKLILSSTGLLSASNRIRIEATDELPPAPPDESIKMINEIPKQFKLEQNYPNPFNPITIINYQLPVDCWVTLKVYNMLGEEVVTLIDKMQTAGFKSIEWNAEKYPSGIYYVKINVEGFTDVKKIVIIK